MDELGLPSERTLPGLVESLNLHVAFGVSIDDRLDRSVVGALTTQNDSTVADEERCVQDNPAVRTDRLGPGEHSVSGDRLGSHSATNSTFASRAHEPSDPNCEIDGSGVALLALNEARVGSVLEL
jgi:hypothetical protein